MHLQLLPAKTCRLSRWKNGRGETAEIAVFPAKAGLDDFGWRISMATVAMGGPFSSFLGVDRTLSLLRGKGMNLSVAGRQPIELTLGSAPFAFAADLHTDAALVNGPVQDLNVMTRRGSFAHQTVRRQLAGPVTFCAAHGWLHLFCVSGGFVAQSFDTILSLEPLDSVLVCNESEMADVAIHGDGDLLVTQIGRADGAAAGLIPSNSR